MDFAVFKQLLNTTVEEHLYEVITLALKQKFKGKTKRPKGVPASFQVELKAKVGDKVSFSSFSGEEFNEMRASFFKSSLTVAELEVLLNHYKHLEVWYQNEKFTIESVITQLDTVTLVIINNATHSNAMQSSSDPNKKIVTALASKGLAPHELLPSNLITVDDSEEDSDDPEDTDNTKPKEAIISDEDILE